MKNADRKLLSKMMFGLLPAQIFLAAVGSLNSIISSLFAGNYLGEVAMSAVGLYLPFNMLLNAVTTMLLGGATILCGRYIGENAKDKVGSIFMVDLFSSVAVSVLLVFVYIFSASADLWRFLYLDREARSVFNRYLSGQAVGIFPIIVGGQLSSFLSLENKKIRTTIATIGCVAVTLAANLILVGNMKMGIFGLSLSTSLGMWAYLLIQAQYYLCGSSGMDFSFSSKKLNLKELPQIAKTGLPGAVNYGYQAVRGLVLNALILKYIGTEGLSAFSANDSFLRLFWAIPFGMAAVTRMVFSIGVGEEDRQMISDTMRVVIRRYVPLMAAVALFIALMSKPFTMLYYRDTSFEVYDYTRLGFIILPLAMPISAFSLFYICYGQSVGKLRLVHFITFLSGVFLICILCVVMIPFYGQMGLLSAHVIAGLILIPVILISSCIENKGLLRTVDDLMAYPPAFGYDRDEWQCIGVVADGEASDVAEKLQKFCLDKGIDKRRAYFAALATEEMAALIISHGISHGSRNHEIDIRLRRKGDHIIIRIKDNCRAYNPTERMEMVSDDDFISSVGIRIVSNIAKDVQYQSILGLNALTITI